MAQNTFERIEEKYLLNPAQLRAVQRGLVGHMYPDPFGRSTISSIYYDTDDYRLIRASLDKPKYKEKLRVRGYGKLDTESKVFVELKKKYDGVVYKRRTELPLLEADALLSGEPVDADSQVIREIRYFMKLYDPYPRVLLSYRRIAYTGAEAGLRITFDDTIRFRTSTLMMSAGAWGQPILPKDQTLMEIKVPGAMPLWLCDILNENGIYPTSFSKYGTCYRDYLYPEMRQAVRGGSYA